MLTRPVAVVASEVRCVAESTVLEQPVRHMADRFGAVYAAQLGAVAVVYYGSAKLGLSAGALSGNVTPVWPPTGLALAALVLFGYRLWPGVALGALLVNGLSPVPLLVACGMATGNTLEALCGAYLVNRIAGLRPPLTRLLEVFAIVGPAALLATMVSASIGVASLVLGGVVPAHRLWSTWGVWWVGDAVGALVVAPLALTWLGGRWPRLPLAKWLEAGGLLVALVGVTALAFLGNFNFPYLVFPALIWAALRLGQRVATSATLAVAIIAVLATSAGRGPFAIGSATHDLWILDTFLAVIAVTVLVLAAVTSERDHAGEEVRALSDELRQRVVELQGANKELEAFTYTVSHDLRAPLRNIDGFSRSLLKRCGPLLDAEGQRYIGVVRRNAQAMGTLIDELLSFSRLQRQSLRTEMVDLASVVDQVLGTLHSDLAGRHVDLVIGDLPVCSADPALLAEVYVNLIGNALKFTRKRDPARIEIGSTPGVDGQPTMFVRDNGVGFDMAYVDKLFGVFQRLHRIEDYEGSGVGLAIVERIVTRHGGRVWAEGALDTGTTMHFTLGAN